MVYTTEDSVPSIITPSIYNGGDASAMTKYVKGMKLKYDDTAGSETWDWDLTFKEEDIIDESESLGTVDATRSISPHATEGVFQDKGTYNFEFDGTTTPGTWSLTSGPAVTSITGGDSELTIELTSGTVIEYDFNDTPPDDSTIELTIKPSPPKEYPDATIRTLAEVGGGATDDQLIQIDFDGNENTVTKEYDLQIQLPTSPTAGSAELIFSLNPDTPPAEYPDAELTGDQTKAVIDLDGSGNEDDSNDIEFLFSDDLDVTGSKDVSLIEFDIGGSTAWKSIDKDDVKDTGYFSFTADFLGGDDGSTESDIKLDLGANMMGQIFKMIPCPPHSMQSPLPLCSRLLMGMQPVISKALILLWTEPSPGFIPMVS